MKSLFVRLYLFIAIAVVAIGWSLDSLYENQVNDTNITSDFDLHSGTLFMLNRELSRVDPSNQQAHLEALAPSFGYPISLVTQQAVNQRMSFGSTTITDAQLAYLANGGIVTIFDDFEGRSWFLQTQTQGQHVIVLGPILNEASTQSDALFATLFLGALALVIFVWVWPISKGLLALSKAADEFGKGDFSARVDENITGTLAKLAQRFNHMADRIQRLLKSHKELSHAVSHELRTPVARIRFAMEMAAQAPCEDSMHRYFDKMDDNIVELDGLIDELLTYARFDREEPSITLAPVPIENLAEKILSQFRMTHDHISYSTLSMLEAGFTYQSDEAAMHRVLDNLVRNAVRYADSTIEIQLSNTPQYIEICVNDDGPGIPESCRATLFDPFVRLDQSRDRNSGGIGLGLAIVKRYVELHQGTITIDTADLGGASFVMRFPHR